MVCFIANEEVSYNKLIGFKYLDALYQFKHEVVLLTERKKKNDNRAELNSQVNKVVTLNKTPSSM